LTPQPHCSSRPRTADKLAADASGFFANPLGVGVGVKRVSLVTASPPSLGRETPELGGVPRLPKKATRPPARRVGMYACMYVCIYLSMYVCMRVCMHVHRSVCASRSATQSMYACMCALPRALRSSGRSPLPLADASIRRGLPDGIAAGSSRHLESRGCKCGSSAPRGTTRAFRLPSAGGRAAEVAATRDAATTPVRKPFNQRKWKCS